MLDEQKLRALTEIQAGINRRVIPPLMANFLQQMEQTKAFDRLFLKEGVEENEVGKSIEAH